MEPLLTVYESFGSKTFPLKIKRSVLSPFCQPTQPHKARDDQ